MASLRLMFKSSKNGVDIDRFKQGPDLPAFPRNALIFAKHANQVTPNLEACAIRGIIATVAGHAVGKLLQSPETVMPEYDLVFASGLTAIEAMSCLRAVIVCDGRGLARLVTLKNYRFLRQKNFGLRSLATPLTTVVILRELDHYSAPEAIAVGLQVRLEAALPDWAAQNAQQLLTDARIDVKFIKSPHRLLPGGARNLGIHATQARYVAFLAADCTAETGWIAERLKAHHQGHSSIASALICHEPKNPSVSISQQSAPGAWCACNVRWTLTTRKIQSLFVRDKVDTCDDGVPFQDRVEDLWLSLKARWQHVQIRLVLINVPSFVPPCQQVQPLMFEDLPGEPPEAWRGKDVQWATASESLGLPASTAGPPFTGKPSPDESV